MAVADELFERCRSARKRKDTRFTDSLLLGFFKHAEFESVEQWMALDRDALLQYWYVYLTNRFQHQPTLGLSSTNQALHHLLRDKGLEYDLEHARRQRRKHFKAPEVAMSKAVASPGQKEVVDFIVSVARNHNKRITGFSEAVLAAVVDASVPDMSGLQALDGDAIVRVSSRLESISGYERCVARAVHCSLVEARRQPGIDGDRLLFNRFTRFAPLQLFETFPELYDYPVEFARFLHKLSEPDRDLVMSLLAAVTRGKVLTSLHRKDRNRVYRSASQEVMLVIGEVCRLCSTLDEPMVAVLPVEISKDGIVGLLAKLQGRYQHEGRGKGKKQTTVEYTSKPQHLRKVMCSWMGHGVFPSVQEGTKLSHRAVDACLFELEEAHPQLYKGKEDSEKVQPGDPVFGDTELQLLMASCHTARQKAYALLSLTTGLRREAMALIRIDHVWDASCGVARHTFTADEKGSVKRPVSLPDNTREALAVYVRTEHSHVSPFLFYSSLSPLVPQPQIIRTILARLCRQAGLPIMHHHQWRQYITNSIVANGGGIELACKFLGHRNMQTTFKHYYTALPDVMHILLAAGKAPPDAMRDAASEGTTVDMERLVDKVEEMKRRIEDLERENKRLKLTTNVNSECSDSVSIVSITPDWQSDGPVDLWNQIL